MPKINCWEFKKCGRQPGGEKTAEFGVCPASAEARCQGINGGDNGGRSCWAIAGTLCGGQVQGSFAMKLKNCLSCEFYKSVIIEEGAGLTGSADILKIIQN